MAKNIRQTSPKMASKASETLRNPKASKLRRGLAVSALAQAAAGTETGKEMERKAGEALAKAGSSELTKDLEGSLVSPSRKSR